MSDELKSKLAEGLVVVKFTKVDGTERTMMCTTNEALIPTDKLSKSATEPKVNDLVARVFDTEIGAWRSFRYNTVISFE